jgi:dephospho-CoA kinase
VSDRRPLTIGLTGNIATGKSTVARMLAELGAETIDADKPAHAAIVETFGAEVLAPGGGIDRERLGAIVFADAATLARLEAIIHPATIEAISRRVAASPTEVIVVEAIKLIEAGMAEGCDSVWVTTCRPEQQIARLMKTRDLSRAEAEQRVRVQPPQEVKLARADVVIDTSGTIAQTRERVQAAWERLVGAEEI